MIDLKAVAAELANARLARLSADAASADIEEMLEDMHRAAYRQMQMREVPTWRPSLRLAS
jgi:hypothetical protein